MSETPGAIRDVPGAISDMHNAITGAARGFCHTPVQLVTGTVQVNTRYV